MPPRPSSRSIRYPGMVGNGLVGLEAVDSEGGRPRGGAAGWRGGGAVSWRESSSPILNSTTVLPTLITSPVSSSIVVTLRSLTEVPLVLPMSISRQDGGLTSTRKWIRDKD